MELEKIDIQGINSIYALSVVKKEFRKAVAMERHSSLATISKEIDTGFGGIRN